MERMRVKKGNLFIYIVLLAVAIAVMFFTRNLSRQHAGSATPDSDTIVVGMQISPMGVYTNGDTLSGFCYEMLRAMTASKGIKLNIEGFSQVSSALDRLKKGIYDIVVADIATTAELKDGCLLTIPIYSDRQVLVQHIDSLMHLPPIGGDTIYIIVDNIYNSELGSRMDSCITRFKNTPEFYSLVGKHIGRTN